MLIYANYWENHGVDLNLKEAYPIVKQLEKNNGQKSTSESSKMREKQLLGPQEPPLVT